MSIKRLLDFIAKPESGGDYNIVYGGIARKDRPSKPLTSMTIGEVLDWQDSIDPFYPSEAAGKYQIMEDTLRGLYREAGLTRNDKFDESGQDYLATQLLRRRGLTDYMSGRITPLKFAQNLSKEWASLPCTIKDRKGRPARGQSYYAGDGLNKSHVTIEALMQAVEDVKDGGPAPAAPKPPTGGFWASIIKAIFGGKK
ncbi:hypothetical protein PVV74_17415 [Roseovarius sp. SK2]|uniref:hypothetical protein n=1 Tax=Roseovarius TaxID=74030 RepID=UPI00237B947E|nr:hypothetical protein [Roseovarius sp. SK2]MDD9727242.1 hypothetical protein [Roseovarius sp. SK2]